MKRVSLGLAGAAMLLVLLPLTLSSCYITCGCTSTPDPNWTPPPVTASDAAWNASKYAAGIGGTQPTDLVASLAYASPDHPVYVVTGAKVSAIVDSKSGLVLELVVMAELPNSKDATISSDAAQAAATKFLADHFLDVDGLAATTRLQDGTATSAYVTTWTGPGFDAPGVSVWVNSSGGAAFAVADQRHGVQLTPPSIGREAAGRLALASVSTPGMAVMSADFMFNLANSAWAVNLATPGPTGDTAPEHGAYVEVDAVTGKTTAGTSY
jgi:hypothetical protein